MILILQVTASYQVIDVVATDQSRTGIALWSCNTNAYLTSPLASGDYVDDNSAGTVGYDFVIYAENMANTSGGCVCLCTVFLCACMCVVLCTGWRLSVFQMPWKPVSRMCCLCECILVP